MTSLIWLTFYNVAKPSQVGKVCLHTTCLLIYNVQVTPHFCIDSRHCWQCYRIMNWCRWYQSALILSDCRSPSSSQYKPISQSSVALAPCFGLRPTIYRSGQSAAAPGPCAAEGRRSRTRAESARLAPWLGAFVTSKSSECLS